MPFFGLDDKTPPPTLGQNREMPAPSPSEFILASGSPRRKELLSKAGWIFRVATSGASELSGGLSPEGLVRMNAGLKAKEVSALYPDALVLGADTTVALGEQILNKPADIQEAMNMLRTLSGKTHMVYTAFTLLHEEAYYGDTGVISNQVTFKDLDEGTISAYLSKVHTLDKAGGYAIQEHGDMIIQSYDEPLSNIIGLPIEALGEILLERGYGNFKGPA
jgi:septum formation protein